MSEQPTVLQVVGKEVGKVFRVFVIILMYAIQEVVGPLSEVHLGKFAAAHHGVDGCCLLSSIMVSTEEIVFVTQSYRTYTVLDEIIQKLR